VGVSTSSREFAFSERDFEHVRERIRVTAGISLADTKQDLVYSRLSRRLRALGLKSFSSYLAHLDRDHDEQEHFVNALTTNLTSFFREAHHFPILARHFSRLGASRPFRVWCSACSTGEEAYSIAIALAEAQGRASSDIQILASDLDTKVLEAAARGVYAQERVASLGSNRLKQFFLKGTGANEGTVMVRPELKRLIGYQQVNLLDARWDLGEPFDAIFCRNVMIYFDKPTQRALLQRMKPHLKADGLLMAGHSESLHHCTDLFTLTGNTVYRHT
jgi:chemotaxis protein methyltransferase CheR